MTVNESSRAPIGSHRDLAAKDVDKLLALAEQLQEKCDESSRRMSQRIFILLAMAGAIVGMIAIVPMMLPTQHSSFWTGIGVLYLLAIAAFGLLTFNRSRENIHRDVRALYAIVDMLREIEASIAKESKMSTLERAEFRIRLSRFGIGSGHRNW